MSNLIEREMIRSSQIIEIERNHIRDMIKEMAQMIETSHIMTPDNYRRNMEIFQYIKSMSREVHYICRNINRNAKFGS